MEDSLAWFPEVAHSMPFMALALAGEAGEFANLVKKMWRGSGRYQDLEEKLIEEATDIFIYLMNIFALLEVNPIEAYGDKRAINVNSGRFAGAAGQGE